MKILSLRLMITCSLFLLILLCLNTSHSDEVIRKNGDVIECVILKENQDSLVIEKDGQKITLPSSVYASYTKVDETENMIRKGDSSFEKGSYLEAIHFYNIASKTRPGAVKEKTREARKDLIEETRGKYAGIDNLDRIERELREKLDSEKPDSDMYSPVRDQLTILLMIKAERAEDRVAYMKSVMYLIEAHQMSPDMGEPLEALVSFLSRNTKYNYMIPDILVPHINTHTDDIQSINAFMEYIEYAEPWQVLQVFFPDGRPYRNATPEMKEHMEKALRECFHSHLYPEEVPFDRITCYEHIMNLNPQASPLPLLLLKVESDSENPDNHHNLARYYVKQEQYEKAMGSFQKALDLNHNPSIASELEEAKVLREKKEISQIESLIRNNRRYLAQVQCKKLLAWMPESKRGQNLLAKSRFTGSISYQGTRYTTGKKRRSKKVAHTEQGRKRKRRKITLEYKLWFWIIFVLIITSVSGAILLRAAAAFVEKMDVSFDKAFKTILLDNIINLIYLLFLILLLSKGAVSAEYEVPYLFFLSIVSFFTLSGIVSLRLRIPFVSAYLVSVVMVILGFVIGLIVLIPFGFVIWIISS